MKKKLILGSTLFLIGLFAPTLSNAQTDGTSTTQQVNMTVGGSSLIGITGGAVDLSLTAGATVAGQSLLKQANNSNTRLRISSYVTALAPKNKITAQVTEGTLYQKYTKLYLRLLPPTSSLALEHFINYDNSGVLYNQGNEAADEFGLILPVDEAIISSSDVETNPEVLLADNIGFCWSGTAADDGYKVEYSYASVEGGTPKNAQVTVTFTIATDN